MTEELKHEGTPRHSGRYPWGSGENPHQRNKEFLDYVYDLAKNHGMSEKEIALGMGISTTVLRARKKIAKNEQRKANELLARELKDRQMSTVAIGRQMNLPESSVRDLLDPSSIARADKLNSTAGMLKDNLTSKRFVDIGAGTENNMGVSQTMLKTAAAMLQEEGYQIFTLKEPSANAGQLTTIKVLAPPDATFQELVKNKDQIKLVGNYTEDSGRTWNGIEPPASLDSKRVAINYAEDGGDKKDGIIELRRGVEDLSLGDRKYAQVRIAVDDTHYLKGMAMYSDNLPNGVDVRFNTNKKRAENPGSNLEVMKKIQSADEGNAEGDNPFGSVIYQRHYVDKNGATKLSPLNRVGGKEGSGEEGAWSEWSKALSSQMLSKQPTALAKQQLDLSYDADKANYDEILSLTNPAVKKLLLQTFSDSMDSSAVHLKAAAMPRQGTHVILPIESMKNTEVYAPNYNNGDKVVLVRFPHGGIFEIPELTVNNRNPEAKSLIGNAEDAVGITAKVAEQLSGADFDGDTVLVIPNNNRAVKTSPPLEALKDFDPKVLYPKYEGMKVMSGANKQKQMGVVSNLITDMTIKGATQAELARAVKHSMVVIDAEKHELNYKLSEKDNNIAELKLKYQGKPTGGASTIISKASSEQRVLDRRLRRASEGGPIDPVTGEKVYTPTGKSYVNKEGDTVYKKIKSTKLAEAKDAFSLVSDQVTPMEAIYANHANRLKALANEARKTQYNTPSAVYSPSARKVYDKEVASLNGKLNVALKNSPFERQAQLFANTTLAAKKAANPNLDNDQIKKIRGMAIKEARDRFNAKKEPIVITPSEWQAIQAGAVTNNKLTNILKNADLDQVKLLALPHDRPTMSTANIALAKSLLARGFTQAEAAERIGVSTSTIAGALK